MGGKGELHLDFVVSVGLQHGVTVGAAERGAALGPDKVEGVAGV
eukprot:COSAG05_NODE_497_length_9246_cov_6.935343_4_plen_44_part_00